MNEELLVAWLESRPWWVRLALYCTAAGLVVLTWAAILVALALA